jgi:hypothetical protein
MVSDAYDGSRSRLGDREKKRETLDFELGKASEP